MEDEPLAAESGSHESEQDCTGPDQRDYGQAPGVSKARELRARIGNAGTTGVGEDAQVRAGKCGNEQLWNIFLPSMFVQNRKNQLTLSKVDTGRF